MKTEKIRAYINNLPDTDLKAEMLKELDELEKLALKQSSKRGIEQIKNIGGREIISHICPACNGHIEQSHRYCKNCGQKVIN